MYYRDPDLTDWEALGRTTTGDERPGAIADISEAREMNLKQLGDAIFRDVEIGTPETGSDGVRSAVVSYCEDPSKLDLVDTSTGEPVVRTAQDTLASRVTMHLLPDGTWRAALYESVFQQC
ncbi:MAG: hypothetical protein IPJ61_00995 [Tessaracoccus sp.]|nr:hypothetical protein [Tessaracoccus sp.]